MLLVWPLTTSAEIAGMLRPGGHLRPDSALRTLRDRGLAPAAISVVPRSDRGVQGRVVWYSSLTLDVARLIRVGDVGTATAAHAAATKLAGHRSAAFVADWLAEHGGPEPDPAALDLATGGALTRLAMLTSSARDKLTRTGVRTFTGRVRDTSGGTASIVAVDGQSMAIPLPAGSSVNWSGAVVAVDVEEFAGTATTLWVRPAFDPDANPNERVPGGPRILTSAERQRLELSATSAR